MSKYTVFTLIFVLIGAAILYYTFVLYNAKLREIRNVDYEIQKQEEQLIGARILNREVKEVARLIEGNLAMSQSDSLVKERSLDFLKYLTPVLDKYNITLIAVEPNQSTRQTGSDRFYRTTHDLHILCNYKQFGNFVAELERSERLTNIQKFDVLNSPYDFISPRKDRELDTYEMKLTISTLTLVKEDQSL